MNKLIWASTIVDAYENNILKKQTKESIYFSMYAPLNAMGFGLHGADRLLKNYQNAENRLSEKDLPSQSDGPCKPSSAREKYITVYEPPSSDEANVLAEEVLSSFGIENADEILKDLAECFNCDLKANFNWQLQPLLLLNPITALLDEIENILNQLDSALDPMNLLKNLCNFFDGFRLWCLSDLIRLMLAIQLLIQKYIALSFRIQLDWTAIIGPLISGLLNNLSKILDNIYQIIIMPIECLLGALRTTKQLIVETTETVLDAASAVEALSNIDSNVDISIGSSGNVAWEKPADESDIAFPMPSSDPTGTLKITDEAGISRGLEIKADDTFEKLFKDKDFRLGILDPIDFSILSLQEVEQWLEEFYGNILYALYSIQALTQGSIAIKLQNAGLILALLDLLNLIRIVIKLKKELGDGFSSWCDTLENNPEIIENALQIEFPSSKIIREGKDVFLEMGRNKRLLRKNGECLKSDNIEMQALLDKWAKELKV